MAYRDLELDRAERALLEVLEEAKSNYSSSALIASVTQRHEDISEEAISVALWDLIGRTEIELTPDWKLKPAAAV